jgi:hypothetical protein
MYPIRETTSQRGKTQIMCENYMFSFHHVLGFSESRWRCINKTCKAFILTVGEGSERIFSSGKFSHYLSFVRSLVHPKWAMGTFNPFTCIGAEFRIARFIQCKCPAIENWLSLHFLQMILAVV